MPHAKLRAHAEVLARGLEHLGGRERDLGGAVGVFRVGGARLEARARALDLDVQLLAVRLRPNRDVQARANRLPLPRAAASTRGRRAAVRPLEFSPRGKRAAATSRIAGGSSPDASGEETARRRAEVRRGAHGRSRVHFHSHASTRGHARPSGSATGRTPRRFSRANRLPVESCVRRSVAQKSTRRKLFLSHDTEYHLYTHGRSHARSRPHRLVIVAVRRVSEPFRFVWRSSRLRERLLGGHHPARGLRFSPRSA